MKTALSNNAALVDLTNLLGQQHVLSDAYSCTLYAQDVYTKSLPALAVVQPGSTSELANVIKITSAAGLITVPRGGGMSYTSGYVPTEHDSIIIDTSRMDRVIEINEQDMYVTVECGCTWKALHDTLRSKGLRTPFWGTLSGIYATVGGGLSQNGMFWGSGQFGAIADSVIGMDVVIADGSIITTGAGAQINGTPFFRHFGPDTTGIFIGDTGSLGFKANATFRLMRELPAKQYISIDFSSAEDALHTMSEISRKGLAMECFGFDPFLQAQRMKRESLASDAKALLGFMKSAGSIGSALKQGAKIALAGRSYMDDVTYSVQIMIEEKCPEAAELSLKDIRSILKQHNGREIENSIPKILRANPFGPVNNMVGPEGERWVCVHGLFPHSKVVAAHQAVEAIFSRYKTQMDEYKIGVGYLFATISTNAFVLEPVFFWQDKLQELHEKSVTPSHFAKLKKFPENLEARAMVQQIKTEVAQLFSSLGSSHFQIGKTYLYADGLQPNTFDLVKAIKQYVDPNNLINPGSLGF